MAKVDTFKLKGQILDARYQVESVVGEGGFGVVYRATQVNFDEPVAIKVLKIPSQLNAKDTETFVETFRAEGKHLRKLSSEHPAFVRAHDTGVITVDGIPAPYLVLEWLDGQPLEDELAERREIGEHGRSLQESMSLLEPIFGAVAHAHAQRVAHRDIKPANIFMAHTKTGTTAKLLDFGMAKVMTATGTQGLHAATQGGLSGLTPAYAAPEQWDKKMSATGPWTDVYALALVLVELLTDQPPLDGDDMPSLMAATLDEETRPTPKTRGASVTPEVEAVFAKAIAFHPKDRYRHAGEFWNALVEASEKVAAIATGQTLSRIAMPEGEVLQPGDVPPEGRASSRPSKTRSKASVEEASTAATIPATIPLTDSIEQSTAGTRNTVKQSAVSAQSVVRNNSVATPSAEQKKSSSLLVPLLVVGGVIIAIVGWKFQTGGSAGPTNAANTATVAPPPLTTVAEAAPKPKKKSTKWWEDLPDPNDATAKASAPKLPPNRQKWLALRQKSEALGAEKKVDEATAALREALDLACKELGQEDAACLDTMRMLGLILARMGKLEEAEQLLREAVKLNEKFGDKDDDDDDATDARKALIGVLVKQGKEEEAKEFWRPTDPPLPAPKASASAAPSAAPVAIGSAARQPVKAAPAEDSRDPWTQIIDEISEEKKGPKPGNAAPTTTKK